MLVPFIDEGPSHVESNEPLSGATSKQGPTGQTPRSRSGNETMPDDPAFKRRPAAWGIRQLRFVCRDTTTANGKPGVLGDFDT
jgi:hypothetical protein